MGLTTVLILAIGLAMDAFAVSISNAMCYRNMNRKWALLTAGAFGLFQGIMPVIGWLAGITFTKYIESIDHYIALVLLGFIGIKMIVEAIREIRHPEACDATKQLNLKMLGVQAVATSIDALAVGISFAAIHGELNIFASAGIICGITFICSLVGILIGKKFGGLLGQKAEIFGGLILVLIGVKIFLEHTLG